MNLLIGRVAALNPTGVQGGITNSTGTVTLNAPALGYCGSEKCDAVSLVTQPRRRSRPTWRWLAGAMSANFTVTSHIVSANSTASISATLNGGTQSAVFTVTPPPAVASLTLNPVSIAGGITNSTATRNAECSGGGQFGTKNCDIGKR